MHSRDSSRLGGLYFSKKKSSARGLYFQKNKKSRMANKFSSNSRKKNKYFESRFTQKWITIALKWMMSTESFELIVILSKVMSAHGLDFLAAQAGYEKI